MRMIDADALIEDVRKNSESYFADDFAREWVDKQPTVEPQRIKGRWIKISPAGIYECSICGKNVMTSDIEAYDYCHGCGYPMRGVSE